MKPAADVLAALEERIANTDDPDVLVALASQVDQLGAQLAFELSRFADTPSHVEPLKPVMMRVPALASQALLRAAERFDDRGSPRRAAIVLFRALHHAIDRKVVRSLATALAFVLDAHEHGAAGARVTSLVDALEQQRAAKVPLREARTSFQTALEAVKAGLAWDTIPDDDAHLD